jgi:hypothetical protein
MLNLQGPAAKLCPKCYFSWVETFSILAKFEFTRVRRKKTSNEIGSAHYCCKATVEHPELELGETSCR